VRIDHVAKQKLCASVDDDCPHEQQTLNVQRSTFNAQRLIGSELNVQS
jgi:hypothetical protein